MVGGWLPGRVGRLAWVTEKNVCYGPAHPQGQIFLPGVIIGGRCPTCRSIIARRAHLAKVRKHGYFTKPSHR